MSSEAQTPSLQAALADSGAPGKYLGDERQAVLVLFDGVHLDDPRRVDLPYRAVGVPDAHDIAGSSVIGVQHLDRHVDAVGVPIGSIRG